MTNDKRRVERSEFAENPGWVVVDEAGLWLTSLPWPTKREAVESLRDMREEERVTKRNADRVDGYDRDDLGCSPDW